MYATRFGDSMKSKPRIAIVDTYYPNFLNSARSLFRNDLSYQENLDILLDMSFGTADFYSKNLRKHGFEVIDIIANYPELQDKWRGERPFKSMYGTIIDQVDEFQPDIVFFQDLSLPTELFDDLLDREYILAGQCSCPMPPEQNVKKLKMIFTSFPHYINKFNRMGVGAIYNKLAFEHSLLDRIEVGGPKKHHISFVGGVGAPSHWSYGMKILESIAVDFKSRFKCWGYGYSLLPIGHPLRACYQGEAWGLRMYQIYAESHIVVNRHGEVAKNFMNNMRCFEATGCGSLLITDMKDNIRDFFEPGKEVLAYDSPKDMLEKISWALDNPVEARKIALEGQRRTLKEHTYEKTMKNVADNLWRML